jgi:acyl-CoA thioesterase II
VSGSSDGEWSSEIVTDSLHLTPTQPTLYDLAFTGFTQPCPWEKSYGGDLVAQAAVAAMRSVDGTKSMHSMHSYFMRPVDIGARITYEVEILRDGRGYSTRQVRALVDGKVVYVCLANFAAGESGQTYMTAMPTGLPDPDSLPSAAEYIDAHPLGDEVTEDYWRSGRGFDMRHVPGPLYVALDGGVGNQQAVWVKPFDPLRAVADISDAQRDVAALAYVCDYTILEPALRAIGTYWSETSLSTASLDHAMWFHRLPAPGVLDGWLLYAQEAVAVESGRGAGIGRFFTPDGTHLATVVQEGVIRLSEGAQ